MRIRVGSPNARNSRAVASASSSVRAVAAIGAQQAIGVCSRSRSFNLGMRRAVLPLVRPLSIQRIWSWFDVCQSNSWCDAPAVTGSETGGRPGNYAEQARTYDYTRGASPTVVRAMGRHLGQPVGRTLLDIAGGTGNYGQVFAARGFRVFVLDASMEMLAHA